MRRARAPEPLRVVILTHFYPPEIGAPQTRLHETAKALAKRGVGVRVVTGPPHYPTGTVPPGRRWFLPMRESIDGIPVLRLPMIPRPNGGLLDRLVDNGSFALAAIASWPVVRRADVVLVESPPLFLGLTAVVLRLTSGRPYVFHVADPWPDFPIAMGMLRSPMARRLAYANESLAYAFAASITTVTRPLVERLARKRFAARKVRLLPNGVDTTRFDTGLSPQQARQRLGWPDAALTVVFVGTVGLAQGLSTAIATMERLAEAGIVLHIVGGGADRSAIEAHVRALGLSNVILHAPVPAAQVPAILAGGDATLVMLRRGALYDESLPTKLVEGLAAGRPLVVSADGEAARIVRESGSGVVARPEDPDALATALCDLRDRLDRPEMGRRARTLATSDFDRGVIVDRLVSILTDAAARTATGGRGSTGPH